MRLTAVRKRRRMLRTDTADDRPAEALHGAVQITKHTQEDMIYGKGSDH